MTDSKDGLTVGQTYALTVGSAEVTGFYEEDGVEKVRALLTPLDAGDGTTLLTQRGQSLFSTSIERFKAWQAEFDADQKSKTELATRRQRRRPA
jgi:hypothetical protein